MEPWGINNRSNDDAVKPISPAASRANCPGGRAGAKHRKVSVGLVLGSLILLAASGSFYGWRNSASRNTPGTTRLRTKSPFGKLADELRGASLFSDSRNNSAKKVEPKKASRMSGAPLSLPLFFEANRGQTDERVKFLARSSGYTLFVTPTETVFAGARTTAPQGTLHSGDLAVSRAQGEAILRMKLLESNPEPEINGAKELPGKVNYLIGKNPRDWHTGVPLYEEVRSREVYPGIDLVFHGDQRRLEYDFQVSPGSDPSRIRFKVTGAEKIAVDENGDLLLRTGKNEFRMRRPVIYQRDGERRRPVDGGFSLHAGKLVAFHVGAYDKKKTLVIDPTIIFASFLGAAGQEVPAGMDLDTTNPSALKLYLSGSTTDVTTFTETNTKLGNSPGAGAYAFVAKIDPTTTGSASLDFLTFIGGNLVFTGGTAPCQNLATDLKLDQSGGAGQVEPVLLGDTNCRDFPVTFGGPSTGTDDVFITRLTPNGAGLDNSTLFGGNGSQGLTSGGNSSLFVNQEGTLVLSGNTTSTNLPTTANAYSVSFNNGTPGGFDDCYIAKLDRSFSILYLTYLNVGGNTTSGVSAGCGVGSMDAAGKIYVGGNIVSSTAFSLINGGAGANGFQTTFVGTPGTTPNGFVAVLDPSQSGLNQMRYATYIAGGGETLIQAGTVDLAHGVAVVTGETLANSTTNAPNIPLLNAFQSANNAPAGVPTGFITVMDTTKTGAASLVASTYFGGSAGGGNTSPRAVAFDSVSGNPPTQRIVVGGQTTATDFPTMNPLQASLVGSQNAFVSVFSVPSPGSTYNMSLLFSTYLGGGVTLSGQSESVRGLITDSNHKVYVVGRTASSNFFGNTVPATTVNGFQTACASCGGGTPQDDLAIFVLTPQSGTSVPDLTVGKSHNGSFSQGQSGAQFSITVTNSGTGATVGTVSLADSLPASMTATAMTGTGWSCSIGTLVCTRSDGLAGGASYPVITLTVTVAGNAPPSVTNTVTVSGGSETNTANNTASDLVAITSSVGTCSNNYIGLTNGSWGTATNWSTGAVPISTDVVCIPSGIAVLVNTGLAAANQTINGLNSSGTITFSAGPLTVTNNSVANIINISGGTVAFNGQLTVSGAFTQTSGTFAGTGEVDLNGPLTWSGGGMCSSLSGINCVAGTNGTTNANAGINFPSSSSVVLSFRTLNNNGTATWSGTNGSFDTINGSIINNPATRVWNDANDSSLVFGGGAAVAFNNAGTFEKTGGTATSTVGLPFNNTGTVLGNSSTLSFTGGGNCGSTCSGTYTSGSSGTIAFAGGMFAQSGPINGAGTVNFNGATMDFGTGVVMISTTNINIIAGTLAGAAPGVIDFETRPNWTGGGMCSSLSGINCVAGTNGTTNANAGINFPSSSSVVLSFRTLNNNGTATWSGTNGSFDMINGSIINNPATRVWNDANDSSLVFGGGAAVAFNNAGTFEKTGGTATSTVGLPFNNTGTVLGNSGTLSFTGGGNCGSTCSGTFTPGPSAAINFGFNVFGQSGPINGAGTVNFNGATMNFGTGTETISTAIVNLSAGTLAGAAPGILNFATPLNWTGGGMCSSLSGINCVAGANGTTNANAGINFPSSSSVVLSFRTLNNNGTATWSGTNGSFDMINGSIINNGATSVWNYTNDSSLVFGGGAAVAFNNAGTFEKTGGTATSTVGLPFNNTGTVLGNSSTLSFTGGGNCGSTCSGTFTPGPSAAISFGFNVFGQSGPINGAGTVNFNGATMNFGAGTETISTATVNLSAGTLAGAAPGILNFATLLNWSGGTMCSSLSGVTCVAGANGTTNANAGINFPAGANPFLSFRTLNNNGTATWSGSNGSFDMINGSIINNPATSVWKYTNDSQLVFGGGNAVAFNNAGTFEKTGGTAISTVGLPFNNTGTVLGNSGTLSITGGGNCGSTCSGTFTATAPGAINFSGNVFGQSGPINGTGIINFNGATMNFGTGAETISTATVNFTAGTLGGSAPGILNFSTPLNWTGGTMCSSLSGISCVAGANGTTNANAGINFPAGANAFLSFRTLNNNGTATWSGTNGSFDMINGSIINNGAASIWNYTNDSQLVFGGGAAVAFNNAGTFEKTGGTATTFANVVFNNTGAVTGNSGILSFGSGGNCGSTCSGSFAAGTGGTLSFPGGTYAVSGAFSGAGTANFSGATMNLTGTYGVTGPTNVAAGVVNFNEANPVTIAGPLNFTAGSIAGSVSTLTLPGLFTWSGGTLALPGTTNASGGIAFPNAGSMFLNGGTLNTPAAVTFAAGGGGSSFLQFNGSVVNNTGIWNLQGDDFITFNGGAATAFNNSTGGTFEKTGGTTSSQISTAFNNAGTVLSNAANLFFTRSFTQTAGRTSLNGGSIQAFSTNPLLVQGGSLTGTGTVQGDLTNTGGSVAPGSSTAVGALSLSGSGLGIYSQSSTGAFNVKIGGTAAGQFDTLAMSGAATLGGPLNVSLLNGFSPALGNTFTILTASSVTGIFSTTNFPALAGGLGWHVTYNATNVVLSIVSVSSPVANLNPGSVTFPTTIVNSAAAIQKVQLQNTGTTALTITSIVPTGTDAANYSYTPDATQPCPMSPATLVNTASCLLDIGFLPLTAGAHNNAGITVTDDSGNVVGSTQTVALSGTGIVLSSIAITPAPVSITQGSTQQFTAMGTYSDNSTQNLTSSVTWGSATTSVATITATGLATGISPGTSNITAKQGSVTSPVAVLTVTGATHFAVSAPGIATAGNAITVTVTALDQFNSAVPGYLGTVHFTSSDGSAVLPANATLTKGSGSFQVTLKTPGSQTVTATDTVTATINGTSNSITVGSGLATHFQVTTPGLATVGVATSVNVVALDQLNNPVTSYTGTVHFTSSDASAVLPANTTLTGGAGTFPVTFKTAGSQTVTATDTVTATITGTSNTNLVSTGTATHLVIVALPSVTVGVPFTVVVEALDQFSNIVTTYSGTVHLTSTDPAAVLPANSMLTSGVGSFQVTLKTTGSQTVTATDTVTATITGTSNAITVSSTTATHFVVSAPPSAAAGTAVSVTVGALDQFNNLVTGYTGTMHFTSTDGQAILPANSTLTSGVGVFQVTLKTAGNQTVSATDTVTSTITGVSNTIAVGPIVATHLLVAAPGAATAGAPFNIIVTAFDQFNNVATGYTGTVHFTSTDAAAVLPANVTLTNGTNTLSVTLKTPGSQTIRGTDTVAATITGTSNVVTVTSGTATHFVVSVPAVATAGTPISVSVTAFDQFNDISTGYTGTVHFTSTDGAATLPANTTLANGSGSFPVTLKTAGSQTVTATDTVNGTITGTSGAIAVTAVLQTITVAPTTASVAAGLTQPFTATGHFSDGTSGPVSVNWSSANTAIATINTSGVATGVAAGGPITITATSTTNAAISGTAQLTVTTAVLQTITVAPTTATVSVGLTQPFTATGHFSNGTTGAVSVNWSSANTAIATINSSGLATGVSAGGPVTITATSTTNAAISGTAQLTVTGATLQTITVAPASASVAAGLTQPFTATGHFSDGTTGVVSVNWSSSNTTIATVNASGIATGVKTGGPVTITATSTGNGGISGTAQLAVTAAVLQTITVAPTSASVAAGLTQPFTATGHFSGGTTGAVSVNWTSSNTAIATVNASGVATGVAAGGPVTITATSGNIFGTAQLTVTPLVVTFPLTVTLIGTGTGSVTDNLGSINCVNTAGVITGTCSANYPTGTVVNLTATATQPSTFGGYFGACTGTGACSVTMNSAQAVTASFVPPPKAVPVPFTPGTNVSGMAAYDCPSNPNPSPGNPCLDPNAHATSLTIGQVLTPFTLTVVATEVPPTNGDGICENGRTPGQDLDCRFGSFFTFQTKPNGDRIVPLCDPYANGNCVVYSVFFQNPGQEPDPSMYVGPVNWNITFNNDTFVPPAPWTGSTPQLYYDPSGFVVPNSPYGTDCTTPMLIGNPGVPTNPAIFCQFVFDITTFIDPTKKVDLLIGGKSKVFSDTIVAFPPIFAPVVTVTTTPDAATVTAGSPIGFTIAVSNSAAATANNVSLNTPLPGGTNVNWTISPAYAGPGTCAITGAIGSQVLNCAFGTLNQSTSVSLHILSASSAAGTAISPSTVVVGSQQLLSIGSIVVQPILVTFSGLTVSQTIPAGTSSITLSGVIGNGTQFAPSGETVSISINGVKLPATVGSNGRFSLQFPTSGIAASTTPYPITYSYPGDSLLSAASNSSTTLTIVSPPSGVNLSATLQSASIDVSGNYVFTVRITNSGGTIATAVAVKTAVLTTVVGTTRLTMATTTTLPLNLGNIASLSSVTTTLTFPASAGPPNTAGAISLSLGFTGGSASSTVKATLP